MNDYGFISLSELQKYPFMSKEVLPEIGTKERVKLFETDQKEYGTEVAMNNLIWQVAADIMRKIDVKKVSTIYEPSY